MTLDEAIAHHEWAVENSQGEVRAEHEQYVKWLGLTKLAHECAIRELQESARIIGNELRRENGRLRAENAKLRESLEFANSECEKESLEFLNIRDENAKLRELCADMNKWLWSGADCTECPFTAECDLNAAFESDLHAHICIGWSKIHDRMCELGVDVDE